MTKYVLAPGQKRLPIDGIRETPRAGLPPLRQSETVLFHPNKIVETDLDFEVWVREGVLIRLPEPGQRPALGPDPMAPPKPGPILPLPIPARVEVVREAAPIVRPPQPAESHLTTAPKPQPIADPVPPQAAPAKADLADAGVPVPPAPAPEPIPAPVADPVVEPEPEEPEAPAATAATAPAKVPAKAPARAAKGRNRRGR
jgi:hypothetical protein